MHLTAREGNTRIALVEALGLAPPPGLGKPLPAPVLLGVDLGVVQLPRLISDGRNAVHAPAEQPRMPVLVQRGHGLEHARAAERAMRPGQRVVDGHVQLRIRAEIHAQPPIVAVKGVTGMRSDAGGVSGCRGMRIHAQESARVRCEAERRPGPVRTAVHAVQGDEHPAGFWRGDAPEVALHRDAGMRGQRTLERQIRTGRPIPREQAHSGVSLATRSRGAHSRSCRSTRARRATHPRCRGARDAFRPVRERVPMRCSPRCTPQ